MICDRSERKLRRLTLSDLLDQRVRRDLDSRYPYGWRVVIMEGLEIEIRYLVSGPDGG